MAQKKKGIFFLLAAIALLCAASVGYLLWNKPHKNVEDAPAVRVNAAELYNLFISDSLKAKNLYADKILLVSGRVERVSVNQQSQTIIMLATGTAGAYINCTLEKAAPPVKEQELIAIKGICSGYIAGDADMGLPGDVFLTRCYLSK